MNQSNDNQTYKAYVNQREDMKTKNIYKAYMNQKEDMEYHFKDTT